MIYVQIDKIFENFITNVKKDGVYASIDEIKEATNLMLEIIKQHKDATPEEKRMLQNRLTALATKINA